MVQFSCKHLASWQSALFFGPRLQQGVEYRTAFGETKIITLPDSSTVILNSNSLLRLKSAWKSTTPREVWLDGEAFFSVIHKKNNQPFKVKPVRTWPSKCWEQPLMFTIETRQKLCLNSGRIQLSLPDVQSGEKIMMKPGELVEYGEKKFVKRKVDPKSIFRMDGEKSGSKSDEFARVAAYDQR
jgi:ferric-dicitrate binding protein FerR (iron transport regulator)